MKSLLGDVYIPEKSVHQLAFEKFEEHWNKIALIDGTNGEVYTFARVSALIRQVASGLARLGVTKGDKVAMYSYNSPCYVFMYYAVLVNGATVTPINPSYTLNELTRQLNQFQVSWLYTTEVLYTTAFKAVQQNDLIKGVVCHGDVTNTVPIGKLLSDDGSAYPSDVTVNIREDLAALPSSSGTTGLPKGVMITHHNIVATVSQCGHPDLMPRPLPHQRVVMAVLPFYHVYGMVRLMTFRLLNGDRLVILPRFQPEQFLETIEKYKVTDLPLVPSIVVFLAKSPLTLKYDLSSVLQFQSGAAPLASETEREIKSRIPVSDVAQGYGLTECTLSMMRARNSKPRKPGSSGTPFPNTEVQVVDPATNKVLGPHERGELWARGPQVMKGYWNNPQATREAVDSHGWLHTGDVGYHDEEGDFYIVDRLKELIKYKGFQVAPAELEMLLLDHPSVADVGVIGIPDAAAGELPKAFVVKKNDVTLTAQELMAYVKEKLANHKQLRGGVEFVGAIPKSPSGKILRKELRKINSSKL